MSENTPAQTPAAEPQVFFGVQRVYLKGASLEIPLGAELFLSKVPMDVNLALQVKVARLNESFFEVAIVSTLTGNLAGKTAYLLEVEQAGIFEIRNANDAQLADMLEIGAPSLLAPYLRAQLADHLTRATLPAFFLPEINWTLAAAQKRQEAAAAAPAAPETPVLH